VRQWITEGRLSEESLMKAESDAQFRTLGKFPEFADALKSQPPAIPPVQPGNPGRTIATDDERATALQKIKVPAVGLKVVAIINLILSLWSLVQMIFFRPDLHELDAQLQQLNNPQLTEFMQKMMHLSSGPVGIANVVLGLGMSLLIYMGATKMQKLQSYEFAFTAAVLSVIPCLTPCCGFIFGLIFGIWAITLLMKPSIKAQFK
jgi:predicted PurR-regulated permease PerM